MRRRWRSSAAAASARSRSALARAPDQQTTSSPDRSPCSLPRNQTGGADLTFATHLTASSARECRVVHNSLLHLLTSGYGPKQTSRHVRCAPAPASPGHALTHYFLTSSVFHGFLCASEATASSLRPANAALAPTYPSINFTSEKPAISKWNASSCGKNRRSSSGGSRRSRCPAIFHETCSVSDCLLRFMWCSMVAVARLPL